MLTSVRVFQTPDRVIQAGKINETLQLCQGLKTLKEVKEKNSELLTSRVFQTSGRAIQAGKVIVTLYSVSG